MSFARICATILTLTAVAQATFVINNVSIVGNGTSFVVFSTNDPENDANSVTIELVNPAFNDQFAVGNNIPSTTGNFSFQTPGLIPGPGYSLQLVNNNNASDIFAMTPMFTVTEHDATSSTSSALSASATPTLPPSLGPSSSVPAATSSSNTPASFTQPGSSSSSGSPSSVAPPSTSSNTVFANGANALQVPFALLLVGVAFAFL